MKIGIDLRVLNNQNAGIGRYTNNLLQCLLRDSNDYYLIGNKLPDCYSNCLTIYADLPISNTELADKMLMIKGNAAKLDLLFSPYYPIPEFRKFKGVMTIYDLIPLKHPEFFSNKRVWEYYNDSLRKSAINSDYIITISNSTKDDIVTYYSINPDRIEVIPLAADSIFHEDSNQFDHKGVLKKFKINSPYLLSVCTLEPRKNLVRTIEAFEAIKAKSSTNDLKLVLVGGLGWKYDELLNLINGSVFNNDIILTGYVTDNELFCIYKNAELFVYPSLNEGFGLPVLEAMTMGVPVVTSNNSSLPEVGGDSVLYCDPNIVESISDALDQALSSLALRQKLRNQGMERSKLFSWEETARRTRDVFLKCLLE